MYETHYLAGALDRAQNKNCDLPNTIPDINAFNGYIDGYQGHPYNPPKSPTLLIKKLRDAGMKFIT